RLARVKAAPVRLRPPGRARENAGNGHRVARGPGAGDGRPTRLAGSRGSTSVPREPAAELSRSAPRRWENTTVRHRRFLGLGVLFLLAAILVGASVWWFVHPRPAPYHIVMRGGRSSIGAFGISSGNVFLVSGKPAVLFGTVTKPGAKEELTYVLVFRRNPPGLGFGPLGLPF